MNECIQFSQESCKAIMEIISNSPLLKSFLVGSLSGTCSTIIFQPLDLVKTRLQTPIHTGQIRGTMSMTATFGSVLRHESITGLWKGITPSITRTVPGVGMYFCSLHWLKSVTNSQDPGPLQAICIGGLARSLTGITMLPVTVIKTRFESGVYEYKGVLHGLKTIYRVEGRKGLYCGLIPTIIRDAPFSGLYLMFYTQTKKAIPQNLFDNDFAAVTHFGCGVAAGILASIVTQPADVLKTKMQLYPEKFKNLQSVILYVYERNGVNGFFRGLVPRTLRRALMAAMAWTVYEQITKSINLK